MLFRSVPGTLPVNWTKSEAHGISIAVAGTGWDAGVPYTELRFSGTPSASGSSVNVRFDAINSTAAAQGQTWTASRYIRLVAGSMANAALISQLGEFASGNVFLAATDLALVPTASPLIGQRPANTRTLTQATTVNVIETLYVNYTSGQAIDFTIRIGAPQLEQYGRATSPILTFGTEATRAVDSLTLNGAAFSALWNAGGMTVVVEAFVPPIATGPAQYAIAATDGTANNRTLLAFFVSGTTSLAARHTVAGVATNPADLGTLSAGASFKCAMSVRPGSYLTALNGSAGPSSAPASVPAVDRLNVGGDPTATGQLGAPITRIRLVPGAMPQPELLAA